MTPKEKAEELTKKFEFIRFTKGKDIIGLAITKENAKQCALICVDEILKTDPQKVTYIGDRFDPLVYEKVCVGSTNYWQEVKQEIEKL